MCTSFYQIDLVEFSTLWDLRLHKGSHLHMALASSVVTWAFGLQQVIEGWWGLKRVCMQALLALLEL
jgi:hypothetical protein